MSDWFGVDDLLGARMRAVRAMPSRQPSAPAPAATAAPSTSSDTSAPESSSPAPDPVAPTTSPVMAPAPQPLAGPPGQQASVSVPPSTPSHQEHDRDWYREQNWYRAVSPYGQFVPELQPEYTPGGELLQRSQPLDIEEETTMDAFDEIGDDMSGFDYSALMKGAGGLLSGIADGFGDKKAAQPPAPPPPPPSNTWKYVALGLGGVGIVGVVLAVVLRKK